MDWARAFLATQLIEIPIVTGWLWSRLGWSALGWAFLASAITHPLLWALWPRQGPRWLWLGAGELAVWLVEGALYAVVLWRASGRSDAGLASRRGLGVALLANLSSMFVGLLLLG